MRVETAGGGGFGDPAQRDREDLQRDVRDDKISAEGARKLYGVSLTSSARSPCALETSASLVCLVRELLSLYFF